jgi:DNA-binding CsgD family transcriptional regulator
MKLTAKQIQNFWAKVNKSGNCWEWTGAKKKRGYGNVSINHKVYSAHAISFLLANGRMPLAGFIILHTCDNPTCVNPDHLREGTHIENMLDMRRKGRAGVKLTPRQAETIRSASGTQREIAARFGVSRETVGQIKRGITWERLPRGEKVVKLPLREGDFRKAGRYNSQA